MKPSAEGIHILYESSAPESTPAERPPEREAPAKVQAFVARRRAFFILLGVLVAQLLLLSAQITRERRVRLIQVWAVAVFDPFARALRGISDTATGAWRSYRDLWRAQQQNRELQILLVAAHSQIQQLSEQAAEARRLRDLLEFKNRLPFQTVAAEVIGTSPGESSNAVFIDKGTDAGLTPDLAVITPAGVAGKLVAVFPHSAQVLLITDPSSGAACTLEHSRVQGVLKGSKPNECQMQYVMNEVPVTLGELVLTSGLDQVYPKGLPLGVVTRTEDGSIYKHITVKPAAGLDRLEGVLVVLKPPTAELRASNGISRP
jgi:rod shape-determining protein MreC